MTLTTALHGLVHRIENVFDTTSRAVMRKLGHEPYPIILPYRGFGDRQSFWVRGRVIEDRGVVFARHSKSLLTNIRHTFHRYETDEIPGAELNWFFGASSGSVTTDEEGYFDFTLQPGKDFNAGAAWQDVHLEMVSLPSGNLVPMGATTPVRTPGPAARYGIISDIDDTIVYTGATNFLKHWRTVVANSAKSRKRYPHQPQLYRDLCQGDAGEETNPLFYVSSSPWNLFDLFERYMVLNDIPLGPMLLKDFGLDQSKWLTGGHDGHKTKMIERVLTTYPELNFILIGDSGQRDLAVYSKIAETYPDRVLAVILHDVTPDSSPKGAETLEAVFSEQGIPYIHTDDYSTAYGPLREAGLLLARLS